ncbi:hypothetical protein [Congregicoccus parvus]|uniref:hypothetical protein n=1 Tax=Congregicoccus parvus TaxID=3081749 RepID=UPI003FA5B5EF
MKKKIEIRAEPTFKVESRVVFWRVGDVSAAKSISARNVSTLPIRLERDYFRFDKFEVALRLEQTGEMTIIVVPLELLTDTKAQLSLPVTLGNLQARIDIIAIVLPSIPEARQGGYTRE